MKKTRESYWQTGLKIFKEYVKEHGHPFVPSRDKSKSDKIFNAYTYGEDLDGKPFLLGRWVAYARNIFQENIKKSTPLLSARAKELKALGFMKDTDIKKLLKGNIEENARAIQNFLDAVATIISYKLQVGTENLSLERYFFNELSEQVKDYDDELEPVHRYKIPESKKPELVNNLYKYKEQLEILESAQKEIRELRSEISAVLNTGEKLYPEDQS